MPEIQSPCLSCSLKNYSKDNPTCRDCDARCDYIKIIDGATPAALIGRVYNRASTAKLKQAESYIQEYCEKHFIKLEDLKSRRFSGELRKARVAIAYTLRHEHVLSLKDIGKLLGKTQQAISIILKPKVIKSAGLVDKAKAPKTPQTPPLKPDLKSKHPDKKFTILNFTEHPNLYDYLLKTAKTNFRKPEDHILFLINKERTYENENTYNPGITSL